MNPSKSLTSRLPDSLLILIVVILMALAFAIGLGWEKHSNNKAAKNSELNAPAGWTAYKNTDYNFGFIYPNDFGQPLVNTKSGSVGHSFRITFPSAKNKNQALEIDMSSTDYKDRICTPDKKICNNVGSELTKDFITSMLKSSDKTIVVQDESSFAMVVGRPENKTSVLGFDQIVDLKKANVSAVTLELTKSGGENCPRDKFVSDPNSKCVVQGDYNNLNKIAKSIKDI